MKQYKSLKEVTEPEIVKDIKDNMDEIDWGFDFALTIGGSVFVVETQEEADEIKGSDGLTLKEGSAGFDADETTEDGAFRVLLWASSNAGGDVYFVPKEFSGVNN